MRLAPRMLTRPTNHPSRGFVKTGVFIEGAIFGVVFVGLYFRFGASGVRHPI